MGLLSTHTRIMLTRLNRQHVSVGGQSKEFAMSHFFQLTFTKSSLHVCEYNIGNMNTHISKLKRHQPGVRQCTSVVVPELYMFMGNRLKCGYIHVCMCVVYVRFCFGKFFHSLQHTFRLSIDVTFQFVENWLHGPYFVQPSVVLFAHLSTTNTSILVHHTFHTASAIECPLLAVIYSP